MVAGAAGAAAEEIGFWADAEEETGAGAGAAAEEIGFWADAEEETGAGAGATDEAGAGAGATYDETGAGAGTADDDGGAGAGAGAADETGAGAGAEDETGAGAGAADDTGTGTGEALDTTTGWPSDFSLTTETIGTVLVTAGADVVTGYATTAVEVAGIAWTTEVWNAVTDVTGVRTNGGSVVDVTTTVDLLVTTAVNTIVDVCVTGRTVVLE